MGQNEELERKEGMRGKGRKQGETKEGQDWREKERDVVWACD